jgi:hypothetical protein
MELDRFWVICPSGRFVELAGQFSPGSIGATSRNPLKAGVSRVGIEATGGYERGVGMDSMMLSRRMVRPLHA